MVIIVDSDYVKSSISVNVPMTTSTRGQAESSTSSDDHEISSTLQKVQSRCKSM